MNKDKLVDFIKKPPVVPYLGIKEIKLSILPIIQFSIVFLVFIFILIMFSSPGMANQIQTNNWIETEATVESTELRDERKCSGTGSDQTCSTIYWTHIQYRYEFNEKNYSNDRYTFVEKLPAGIVDKYPTGENLMVFVDPQDPFDSVMLQGWEGIWESEVVQMLWYLTYLPLAFCLFLITWKVSFLLQSTENKQKAIESKEKYPEFMETYSVQMRKEKKKGFRVVGGKKDLNLPLNDLNVVNDLIEQNNDVTSESEPISSNSETSWWDEKSE